MGKMTKGACAHGFVVVDVAEIPEMKAVGVTARHEATGLEVFHILNDDEENLFAYAFTTPPTDSTGVAHILEHSVLCGSESYPLKDPFLVLAKQSVKTFLNAMTFPDKTVYPASSMVEADYLNLMAVYGDAVFFPLLEEWVFRQEGHRFEIDAEGKASIQGVVFNEMRGNYSSFDSVAGDWSIRSILAGTAYAHDSGGDPVDIPALTYAQFREFHERYYHPSNCRVFLCGNMPTERQLELLQTRFLSRFGEGSGRPARVERPAPFAPPPPLADERRFLEVPGPAEAGKDPERATVMVNWLLHDSTDAVALMEANLVAEILLGHDGSPLSRALVESGLGEDIAPSTGLETELKHLCFSAGLRGVERARAREVEDLVLSTLRSVAEKGIDPAEVETAVRSIDFGNREVRRSGGPFALTLMRRSLRGWVHGLSPLATLRYVPAFEEVKRRLAGPGYLQGLVSRYFLENGHRALVAVYPDSEYERGIDERLAARVRLFESGLDAAARERFLTDQRAFHETQARPDTAADLARIPHLRPVDLPLAVDRIPTAMKALGTVPVLAHEQPTNGIAYLDLAIPVDVLEPGDYPLLPFFASALTGMGLGGLSWVEASALTARITGGLGAMLYSSSAVRDVRAAREVRAVRDVRAARDTRVGAPVPSEVSLSPGLVGRDWLILRVKALEELSRDAVALAFRYLDEADFSDRKRLMDLLLEYRNDLESSLAPSGNQYAVSRAAYTSSRAKAIDEAWNGIAQIRFVRELARLAREKGGAESLVSRLDAIRRRLASAGLVANLTGTGRSLSALEGALAACISGRGAPDRPASAQIGDFLRLASLSGPVERETASVADEAVAFDTLELASASLQVGFSSLVLPSPAFGSPDQGIDVVLGHWLANGPLWERIRTTGGAYGAYAYTDALEGLFVLATYRDPQPLRSLAVFRAAIEEAAESEIDPVALERTVTGCYSREVQPRSPSDKGFTAFLRLLYGISDGAREQKLARILSATPAEVRAAAERMRADWEVARGAVLAGKRHLKDAKKHDFAGILESYPV